jgi:hypothetical protein
MHIQLSELLKYLWLVSLKELEEPGELEKGTFNTDRRRYHEIRHDRYKRWVDKMISRENEVTNFLYPIT